MSHQANNSHHWSQDDLIARLYGLDPASGKLTSHLAECADCSAQWAALQQRRDALSGPSAPVPDDLLRAQRQAVWARIEQPQQSSIWRAMPAAATALMLFAGVALHRSSAPVPEPRQVAAIASVNDQQLIEEIATMVNQDSPRAADPIQGLFSEDSKVEAQ